VSGRRDKTRNGVSCRATSTSEQTPFLFVLTSAMKMTSVTLWIKQLSVSAPWIIAVNNAATEGLRGLVTEQTAESYAATLIAMYWGCC